VPFFFLTSESREQTFFSSGVLHWDDDGTLGSDYLVRGAGIRLFLSIALPTTAITVAAWAFMYGVARRWAKQHARGLPGYADEAALPSAPQYSAGQNVNPSVSPIGGEKSGTGLGIM